MEKPANTQYYLRFASEGGGNDLSEFMAIGGGVIGGIGLGAARRRGHHLRGGSEEGRGGGQARGQPQQTADSARRRCWRLTRSSQPMPSAKPPLPKAPRADIAPVEGKEGPRSSKAGGFEGAARQMEAINTQEIHGRTDDGGQEAASRREKRPRQDARRRPATKPGRPRSRFEERSGEKVNGDRTRRESARVQEDQLLQGVPHHRARLERRRALPPREAQAAQSAAATRRASSPATRAS